jgi:hypothetical protein
MRRLRSGTALAMPQTVGDYGEPDPPKKIEVMAGAIPETKEPPLLRNRNSFTVYSFTLNIGVGSKVIVPANERRTFLLIQNQSESDDMYFNLSGDASPTSGVLLPPLTLVVFDTVCPYNTVSVFMNAAALQPGAVMEGTPLP